MSQRNVENFIGRLATDRELRGAFASAPDEALLHYRAEGHDLAAVEITALAGLDAETIDRFAQSLDPRLRRLAPTATNLTTRRSS